MATIGPATLDDIPHLTELLGDHFRHEREFIADKVRQAEGLRQIIAAPESGIILVARLDHAVVGMVLVLYTISTVEGGPVGLLEDLAVRSDLRDQEIDKRLVNAAIIYARTRGLRRLTLLTDHDNAAGQRFYQRHGFVKSEMNVMRLILPGGTLPSMALEP
jgi:ribosomal protein S18 acetylase RimI-like enzyme